MRKSIFILLFLSMSYFLTAQETVKQKEVGLVFNSLNSFGLSYKTGTNKSLWRFNTLIFSGNNMDNTSDSSISKRSNINFGVKLGKEYRKSIVSDLELRFGVDLSFSFTQTKSILEDKTIVNHERLNKITTYSPGINLVFGFNYVINKKFLLGAELLPSFNYVTGTSIEKLYSNNGEETKQDISGYNYGLSNTSVLISVAYRFK